MISQSNSPRKIFSVSLSTLILFFGLSNVAVYADDLLYTGCLSTGAGVIYNAKEGGTPLHPCASGDSPVLGGGDITGILTSGGLTGGGNSGVLSLSIDDLGVTTSKIASSSVTTTKLADGSVTPDKISNDASESNRIQNWSNTSPYTFSGNPNNPAGSNDLGPVIDPDLTVTVPSGKAYYYYISYHGVFTYNYGDRAGSLTSFYGDWSAEVLANTTKVGDQKQIVHTGYRYSWSDVGGNNYWNEPFDVSWMIRLGEGTHDLKMQIRGYSDTTMDDAVLDDQYIQVMRVF